MPIDDTDRRLIALLRKDARLSVAALAAKLGVSRGTVTNRLRKLEDEHVIVGYTLQLRPDAEPNQIRAWMGVLVDGNQTGDTSFKRAFSWRWGRDGVSRAMGRGSEWGLCG